MNEINKKQKELETNYEIYRQNKSLRSGALLFLFISFLCIGMCVLLYFVFHISINPVYGMMFLLILAMGSMSIIAGKIALKTRNVVGIMLFIISFATTIELILLMYFSELNEWEMVVRAYILFAVIIIFVLYIAKKKFNIKMYGSQAMLLDYRNVIIKEGEQIDILTDGYSQRPFSKESEAIKNVENFKNNAENFAKILGKEGIIMDWNTKENSITLFPPIFMEDLFVSVLYLIQLTFRKKKLSMVKISSDGQITVFISDDDYKRITRPVAYHLLCRGLAEKFERAFVEFAKGNKDSKINTLKILKGEK
ncbi:MAG: hypothetical protein CVT88_00340 [Candidatus Altiarchaeales archaeon HGW-Altiarchaeales-1]|nr:MAG: hypothetical protein CVT88_00340 [Candidatus Altiarchaeales archaeon HGW-Altiarchaeales-1]